MSDKDIGKRGRCPKCGATVQVAATAAVPEAELPQPARSQAKLRREQTVVGEPVHEEAIPAEAIQAAPRHAQAAPAALEAEHGLRLPPPLPSARSAAESPGASRRRSGDDWYYSYDDRRVGPMSEAELQDLIDRGEVRRSDGVWKEGMEDWRRADEVFEFYDEPRRRRRRRSRGGGDDNNGGLVCGILACIFGGVAFVFCPILMGLTGIVLGIVSVSISENKTMGIVGLAVSAVGMVVGMILGFLMFSTFGFGRF